MRSVMRSGRKIFILVFSLISSLGRETSNVILFVETNGIVPGSIFAAVGRFCLISKGAYNIRLILGGGGYSMDWKHVKHTIRIDRSLTEFNNS